MHKTENGKQLISKHFGKSMQDIWLFKKTFFNDNDSQLEGVMKISESYLKQPKRENCKMCQTAITTPTYFKSHGINYYLCGNCGHLNGEYDDTECFSAKVYTSEECPKETSDQNGCEPKTGSQEPKGGGMALTIGKMTKSSMSRGWIQFTPQKQDSWNHHLMQ